jgi:hypothetical protein
MTPTKHPVLENLSEGYVVAVEVECPRQGCGQTWVGTAEVVNAYGVRAVRRERCSCGVAGRVTRIVDVADKSTWTQKERFDYYLRCLVLPLKRVYFSWCDMRQAAERDRRRKSRIRAGFSLEDIQKLEAHDRQVG